MRLIDADKLLEGEHFILKCKSEFGITEIDVFRREVIENAPTVETYSFARVQELVNLNQQFAQEIENLKRQKGKWRGNNLGEFSCPLCGHQVLYEEEPDGYYEKLSNFCPFCGADMR